MVCTGAVREVHYKVSLNLAQPDSFSTVPYYQIASISADVVILGNPVSADAATGMTGIR